MKLSIITINLNNKSGLEKTIKSVACQIFRDYEHIVIDGGSADGSLELIKGMASKLYYWVSEPDNGIYNAMNKGILKATGDYLMFLNSGDQLSNSTVLKQLTDDVSISDTDLIYGNLERIFPNGLTDIVNMPEKITVDRLLINTLCHPVTLIKRTLFDKYGLYDENLKIVADWAFFLKVIVLGNVSTVYKNVNVCVFTMDGMSSSLSNQQLIKKEREQVMEQYFSTALHSFIKEKQLFELYYHKYKIKFIHSTMKYIKNKILILSRFISKVHNLFFYGVRTFRTSLEINYYIQQHYKACFNIPIIINNRNRVTYLKRLITSLEQRGYKNIFIIDNGSDYADLSDYYATLSYKIYFLGKNVGYCALWDTPIFDEFKDQYYVYTDSDLELAEACPNDFMVLMHYFLHQYKSIGKVGLSIVTDDIPDYFKLKKEVLAVENKYSQVRKEKMVFDAKVDTTFALYRPNVFGDANMLKSIRTAYPYSVLHLPWYENSDALTTEQLYYYETANASSHWGSIIRKSIS